MPAFLVYHAANPLQQLMFYYAPGCVGLAWVRSTDLSHRPGAPYQLVAAVSAADLASVFALTNHSTRDWRKHPDVTPATPASVRSTNVGDVVVGPDGVPWICAPTGWQQILPDGRLLPS